MMTFFTFSKSGWYEIVSPTHALSNHDIKIGGHRTFWRAISISKMACFWSYLHYIAHSNTRRFWTLTRTHGLIKGQEWLKLMEIVNCGKRNPNHVNFFNFDLFHNARTDTYGRKTLKCSKWPETCCPLIRFGFWVISNFDAHARARRDAHGDKDY